MSTLYVVRPGDYLVKIAREHGFAHWRTIYDAPENEAFRKKRPNPDLIYPGDELFIPGIAPAPALPVTPGPKTTFYTTLPKRLIHITLRARDGLVLRNNPYSLVVDGVDLGEGKASSGDGTIEARLPLKATEGELTVNGFTWLLELSALAEMDPSNEEQRVRGAQQRLSNLGYAVGQATGVMGERTREALAQFQAEAGRGGSGELDPPTVELLREKHGC